MALYHQLKFPSTLIEYRSVSEWKGVVVISNFDSLEAAPSKMCPACLWFIINHKHAGHISQAAETNVA